MRFNRKQILGVALAAVMVFGCAAGIYFTITLTNGNPSIDSASSGNLVDVPPRIPRAVDSGDNGVNERKPFADLVKLAVIPGAARVPGIVLPAAANKAPASPAPIARLPQLVQLGVVPRANTPQAVAPQHDRPPVLETARLFGGPSVPVPASIASRSLSIAPASLKQQREPAASFPEIVTPIGNATPTAMDIAMHPSLKYAAYVDPVAVAVTRSSAAFDVPVAGVGKKAGAWAKAINAASRPAIARSTASEDLRALIGYNLQLEDGRRFVMSMCTDQQGRFWVGSEEDQPGTGGVQCFDPSAPEFHQWTKYTTADGLGDNNGYAVACDRLGRIWVGHLNHGVSVFGGNKWQNYEVVGGLSRPDTLSGPLGERVFAIKVCPIDGDVWIATNAGLTRYSEKLDAWRYYTQSDGLPTIEPQAIAFDAQGNICIGSQCDGIALADASDDYRHWRTVNRDNPSPALPSNLVNDVLFDASGTLYVATDGGLAWSKDKGGTWLSGSDSEPAHPLAKTPPKIERSALHIHLADVYCTCLAEDSQQRLWVGHREQACECFNQSMAPVDATPPFQGYARATLDAFGRVIVGSYGGGVLLSRKLSSCQIATAAPPPQPNLPTGASPPSNADLQKLVSIGADSATPSAAEPKVVVLPDDWRTQGAWLGRYGRYTAILAAMSNPGDYVWGAGIEPANYNVRIGTAFSENDSVRYWRHWLYTTNPKSLEIPPVYLDSRVAHGWTTPDVNRRQSEWDDHGEAYSRREDGPDVFCTIQIPAGRFRLSLYDFNKDGHDGANELRDYDVELWEHPPDTDLSDLSSVGVGRPLATVRIKDFWGGVWKSFAVQGPLDLTVQVRRNHSFNTILAGVMLDTFEERPASYFPAAPGLAAPSVNNSAFSASDDELLSQLQNRAAGSLANLAQDRICYVMVLRHLLAEQNSALQSSRSAQIGTSLFALNEFASWEDCQRQRGLIPARDIEKALKWDTNIPAYSGRGNRTVHEFLQGKTAVSNAPPASAVPQ